MLSIINIKYQNVNLNEKKGGKLLIRNKLEVPNKIWKDKRIKKRM